MTHCPVHPSHSPFCPACIFAKKNETPEPEAKVEVTNEPAHVDEPDRDTEKE